MTQWKNRIVKHGEEAPDQLLAHPQNWRGHPQAQQDALKDVLNEIGIIQDVIVNERTGNMIDGHLRVTLAMREGIEKIPVKYVDLSEAEEKLALATFDPLSALAFTDQAILADLLQDVNTDSEALQTMLADLCASGINSLIGESGESSEGGAGTENKTCPECGQTIES